MVHFYTVGTNVLYYDGIDFINKFHSGIRVVIQGVTYTLHQMLIGEGSYNTNHFQI